jgi:hypothetical protein
MCRQCLQSVILLPCKKIRICNYHNKAPLNPQMFIDYSKFEFGIAEFRSLGLCRAPGSWCRTNGNQSTAFIKADSGLNRWKLIMLVFSWRSPPITSVVSDDIESLLCSLLDDGRDCNIFHVVDWDVRVLKRRTRKRTKPTTFLCHCGDNHNTQNSLNPERIQ